MVFWKVMWTGAFNLHNAAQNQFWTMLLFCFSNKLWHNQDWQTCSRRVPAVTTLILSHNADEPQDSCL